MEDLVESTESLLVASRSAAVPEARDCIFMIPLAKARNPPAPARSLLTGGVELLLSGVCSRGVGVEAADEEGGFGDVKFKMLLFWLDVDSARLRISPRTCGLSCENVKLNRTVGRVTEKGLTEQRDKHVSTSHPGKVDWEGPNMLHLCMCPVFTRFYTLRYARQWAGRAVEIRAHSPPTTLL
ncbi:hypothetical protein Bbelb_005780 [Branchiostoma belcheri]|nr:hypothetical protein Bbelb_005780 [Branchiostoma belcheri]